MGRGRKAGTGNKLYDLYKIINGRDVFIGRFDKKQMHEDYGLSVNNLRKDINSKQSKPGKDGRYRVRDIGEPAEPYKEPKSSGMPKHVGMIKTSSGMPKHVGMIKTSGSCRFGG